MQARAERRFRLFLIVFAALMAVAGILGVLAAGGGGDWLLAVAVVLGVIGAGGAVVAGMMWWVRRRTGSAVSELWGADRRTRQRAVDMIKSQEAPEGEIGRLALAEAERSVKLAPVVAVCLGLATLLGVLGAALQISDGEFAAAAIAGWPAVIWVSLAGWQLMFRRKAAAYLARYRGVAYGDR